MSELWKPEQQEVPGRLFTPARRRQAVVVARDAATRTCSIKIQGDATQHDSVVALSHYVPRVNDTVWCLQDAGNWLILGGQGTPAPAVRIRRTADFTHNSTGNELAVTFPSGSVDQVYDPHAIFATANNTRLTSPWPGVWHVDGGGVWPSIVTGRRYFALRKNGTSKIKEGEALSATGFAFAQGVSTDIDLAAGDYVELLAFQNSGGNLALQAFADHSIVFTMHYVGPT